MTIKPYQKTMDYTYTLGVFETIEALKFIPREIKEIYLKSDIGDNRGLDQIISYANKYQIPLIYSDKTINRLAKKDNCLAIAIINKYQNKLDPNNNHVVLVNPGDMGNMGTILRTMLGFGYSNLAIISPGVDAFNPKVLRSSMGAIFQVRIQYFSSFEEYLKTYSKNVYCLMLKGATNLYKTKIKDNHCLVFGNESSGLSDEYLNYGKSIFIPHSNKIDSLNLAMAVGITLSKASLNDFINQDILISNN